MRLFLLLLACGGLIPIPTAAAPRTVSPLQSESRLSAPITLRLRQAPLCDLAALVSRETGVSLHTSEDTADERVTLFVRERPAREVLLKVAEHFDYSWVVQRAGEKRKLVLIQDLAAKRREQALRPDPARDVEYFRNALERLVREASRPEVRQLRRLPLAERRRRLQELEEALSGPLVRTSNGFTRGEVRLDPETRKRLEDERRLLGEATPESWQFTPTGIAKVCYAAMPESLREALWKGEPVLLAYPPEQGRFPLKPEHARDMVSGGLGHVASITDERTGLPLYLPCQGVERVRVKLALERRGFETHLRVRLRTLGSYGNEERGRHRVECVVNETLEPGWVRPLDTIRQGAVDETCRGLRDPVTLPSPKPDPLNARIPGLPRLPGTSWLEDSLEHLSRLVPYPIIADGYVGGGLGGVVLEGEKPLHAALERLAHCFDRDIRFRDGYLLFRHANWAVQRSREPPARLVRKWQASIDRYGALRFADLLEIAGRLSPQQAENLSARLVEPIPDSISTLLSADLEQSSAVLRFLHGLPAPVFARLEQGQTLPFRALPAPALRMASQLMDESWPGGGSEHDELPDGTRYVVGSGFRREDELERLLLQGRVRIVRKPVRWLWEDHGWALFENDAEFQQRFEQWRAALPELKPSDLRPIEGEMIQVELLLPGAEPLTHYFLHPTRQLAPGELARTGVVTPVRQPEMVSP